MRHNEEATIYIDPDEEHQTLPGLVDLQFADDDSLPREGLTIYDKKNFGDAYIAYYHDYLDDEYKRVIEAIVYLGHVNENDGIVDVRLTDENKPPKDIKAFLLKSVKKAMAYKLTESIKNGEDKNE
jgi:hypothetical protein